MDQEIVISTAWTKTFMGHPGGYFVVSVDAWLDGGKWRSGKVSDVKDGLNAASCSLSATQTVLCFLEWGSIPHQKKTRKFQLHSANTTSSTCTNGVRS